MAHFSSHEPERQLERIWLTLRALSPKPGFPDVITDTTHEHLRFDLKLPVELVGDLRVEVVSAGEASDPVPVIVVDEDDVDLLHSVVDVRRAGLDESALFLFPPSALASEVKLELDPFCVLHSALSRSSCGQSCLTDACQRPSRSGRSPGLLKSTSNTRNSALKWSRLLWS